MSTALIHPAELGLSSQCLFAAALLIERGKSAEAAELVREIARTLSELQDRLIEATPV